MRQIHPLNDIRSEDELLGLNYFDFLSCLGILPLHPGGFSATKKIISGLKLNSRSRVLEIGTGTGATTAALVKAGINLTVVEPNERLLQSTLRNCQIFTGKQPHYIHSTIEDAKLNDEHFDFVIIEAVYGFFADRSKARQNIRTSMKKDGKIGIVDFYYKSAPSEKSIHELNQIMGSNLDPSMNKEMWLNDFRDFKIRSWNDFTPSESRMVGPEDIRLGLEKIYALEYLPSNEHSLFKKMATKVNEYFQKCSLNSQSLMAFYAVVQK